MEASASWRLMIPDGRVGDAGELSKSSPRSGWYCPGAMVIWCAKGLPRLTYELERLGELSS